MVMLSLSPIAWFGCAIVLICFLLSLLIPSKPPLKPITNRERLWIAQYMAWNSLYHELQPLALKDSHYIKQAINAHNHANGFLLLLQKQRLTDLKHYRA